MKRISLLIIITLLSTSLFAQKKETRNVGDFTYISMGINAEVIIKQGNKTELILEGDEDTLEDIESYVSSGKLKLRSNNDSWFRYSKKIKVYITVKEFTGVTLGGSGEVISAGLIKAGNVDLSVSGSGDLDLELSANDVDCSISGSGSIYLIGNGKTGSLSISGSGKMDASEFEIGSISIRISGSGKALVNVTEEIDSRISGSGTVLYSGNPNKISNHASGSGKLKRM